MFSKQNRISYYLAIIGVLWILIGVMRDGNMIYRHLIQALPILVASFVIYIRQHWTWPVAVPLFSIWFLAVITLWNTWRENMESISDFALPTAEALLSLSIIIISVFGFIISVRVNSTGKLRSSIGILALSTCFQFAALVCGAWLAK
jgi:hypothetical protein